MGAPRAVSEVLASLARVAVNLMKWPVTHGCRSIASQHAVRDTPTNDLKVGFTVCWPKFAENESLLLCCCCSKSSQGSQDTEGQQQYPWHLRRRPIIRPRHSNQATTLRSLVQLHPLAPATAAAYIFICTGIFTCTWTKAQRCNIILNSILYRYLNTFFHLTISYVWLCCGATQAGIIPVTTNHQVLMLH